MVLSNFWSDTRFLADKRLYWYFRKLVCGTKSCV